MPARPSFLDEIDLLAHAEPLRDDVGDFFAHLDFPEEEEDATDQEFTPRPISEGAKGKFQVNLVILLVHPNKARS